MRIGIIGNGFVGKATQTLGCSDIELAIYDIDPTLCSPPGLTIEKMSDREIVFISVPTPMQANGECCLGVVKTVVQELDASNYRGLKVLRSTVPPGTSDTLGCHFMPEFLTEKNFEADFRNNKLWIFGLCTSRNTDEDKCVLSKLIELAYRNERIVSMRTSFITNKEAEMAKMFRNTFLATKVSLCNEFAQFCALKGIDYENVRVTATDDDRIGASHTAVPGPDGHKGFGGTCFPKDTGSMVYEMKRSGMRPYILEAVQTRNIEVDRPEKDWEADHGRAVV